MLETFNLEGKVGHYCDVCGPDGTQSPVGSTDAAVEIQTPKGQIKLCRKHGKLLQTSLTFVLGKSK